MPNKNSSSSLNSKYDPRWFIWSIMFLVVTGVLLVTYIFYSGVDEQTQVQNMVKTHKAKINVTKS